MSSKFKKTKEDFICGKCRFSVVGDGYTNHCPQCLWSKHVDVFPGDRLESCGGLMEPTAVVKEQGQEKLVHTCVRCGKTRNNKVQKDDSFEALVALTRKRAETL